MCHRLVKRHCWGESLVVIYCAGPCNIHPRWVLTAAGPPGGLNLTGSMGVMRWGQSEPIRIMGFTLWRFWSGRPARCLYLFWSTWIGCVCFAEPRLLAVKALLTLNTFRGLSIEDTVKVMDAPWMVCVSCLTVQSANSSGWPFSFSFWMASWRIMVRSDPSSSTAYASIALLPFQSRTLVTFNRITSGTINI